MPPFSPVLRKENVESTGSTNFNDLISFVARNRDKQAFISLFLHFAPRVKSFLMRGNMNENEAEELAQETMLMVWQKADQFNPMIATASTWIFTIARNKKIDRMRKNRVVTLDIEDMIAAGQEPSAEMPELDWSSGRMRTRLAEAIKTLPEDQATLVYKAFYEDLSHSEIAAKTQIPLGTVKSRLRMGMARLRASLSETKSFP
jgi:RNA polymerase sigma-70 factor (ECF subfamily)